MDTAGEGAALSAAGKVTIGRTIKTLRAAAGLKQGELARRAGLCETSICHFETGRREPPHSALRCLAREFRLPVAALFYEEGEPPVEWSEGERERWRMVQALLREALSGMVFEEKGSE